MKMFKHISTSCCSASSMGIFRSILCFLLFVAVSVSSIHVTSDDGGVSLVSIAENSQASDVNDNSNSSVITSSVVSSGDTVPGIDGTMSSDTMIAEEESGCNDRLLARISLLEHQNASLQQQLSSVMSGRSSTVALLNNSEADVRRTNTESASLFHETVGEFVTSTTDIPDDPKMVEIFKKAWTDAGLTTCNDKTKCWCPPPDNICYGGTLSKVVRVGDNVSSIPMGACKGITIEGGGNIDLGGTQITSLPAGVFAGVTINKQGFINFHGSKISSLEVGSFNGATFNGGGVNLNYNKLTTIPLGWNKGVIGTDIHMQFYGNPLDLCQPCSLDYIDYVNPGLSWNCKPASQDQPTPTPTTVATPTPTTVATPTPTTVATPTPTNLPPSQSPAKDDPKMVEIFKKAWIDAGLTTCNDKTKCWCPSGDVCYGGTLDRTIDLSNSKITSLPYGVFNGIFTANQYSRILLNKNKISSLHEGVFKGIVLGNKGGIILSNNEITSLPNGVFSNMTVGFGVIALDYNKISSIPADAFEGFQAIGEGGIILDHNQITSLPVGLFKSVTLRGSDCSIYLHNNLITFLPFGLFSNMIIEGMAKLRLDNNKITSIEPGAFVGLSLSAGSILFHGNQMTSLPDLKGLTILSSSVSTVSFAANKITTVSVGWSDGIKGTNDYMLDLGSNPLDPCQPSSETRIASGVFISWDHPECKDALSFVQKDVAELNNISYTAVCNLKTTGKCGLDLIYSPSSDKKISTDISTLRQHLQSTIPTSAWRSINFSKNSITGAVSKDDANFFQSLQECDLSGNPLYCTADVPFPEGFAKACKFEGCKSSDFIGGIDFTPFRVVEASPGGSMTFTGNIKENYKVVASSGKDCSSPLITLSNARVSVSASYNINWGKLGLSTAGKYTICLQTPDSKGVYGDLSLLKRELQVVSLPRIGNSHVSQKLGITESFSLYGSNVVEGDFIVLTSSMCSDLESDSNKVILTKSVAESEYLVKLPQGLAVNVKFNVCFATKESKGDEAGDYACINKDNPFIILRSFEEQCNVNDITPIARANAALQQFDLRTDVLKNDLCRYPPIADQGSCGNCYAWSVTGQFSLTSCIQSGGKIDMKTTISAPMLSRCLTGCGGAHMDRALDYLGALGIYTCENKPNLGTDGEKSGACTAGCIPLSPKYYSQFSLNKNLCPDLCIDKSSKRREGRRSQWCGVMSTSKTDFISGETARDGDPEQALVNVVSNHSSEMDDVVTKAKLLLSSSGTAGAVSTTLLLYSDAIKQLHENCKNMNGSIECDNTWVTTVFPKIPNSPNDSNYCDVGLPENVKKFTTDELLVAVQKCGCWSSFRGAVVTSPRLEQLCGYSPAAHIVQIVGWSQRNVDGAVVKYWILQNQWGPKWGNDGYFYVRMGVNMWGIEDELYYFKNIDNGGGMAMKSNQEKSLKYSETSSLQDARLRIRHTRRVVGGWVVAHHQTSPFAQDALKHLGNEFVGPSPAVTNEERARTCTSHMSNSSYDAEMTYRRHRIVSIESAEMQVVAGVNHRFHVVSQDMSNDYRDGNLHRHRVTVHRRIDGSHSLLLVEHVELIGGGN